jgi:hypothetical protein
MPYRHCPHSPGIGESLSGVRSIVDDELCKALSRQTVDKRVQAELPSGAR